MSDDRYQIDPGFVTPEPTPAEAFATFSDETTPQSPEFRETIDRWRDDGIQQVRVTITGPKATNDKTGYPPGLWLEGWKDRRAQQLPFGASYPDEDGPCYPPLTAKETP